MNTITLRKDVPCRLFPIRAPIWNGNAKRREVGLAEYRLGDHNEIHFTYKRKDGTLSISDHYYISGEDARSKKYKRQEIKGVDIIIIPLDDLKVLYRGEPKEEGSLDELMDWLNRGNYASSIEELNKQGGK